MVIAQAVVRALDVLAAEPAPAERRERWAHWSTMAAAEPSSRRNSTIGCSQMVRLVSSPGTRSSAHMATYQALRRNGMAASVPR